MVSGLHVDFGLEASQWWWTGWRGAVFGLRRHLRRPRGWAGIRRAKERSANALMMCWPVGAGRLSRAETRLAPGCPFNTSDNAAPAPINGPAPSCFAEMPAPKAPTRPGAVAGITPDWPPTGIEEPQPGLFEALTLPCETSRPSEVSRRFKCEVFFMQVELPVWPTSGPEIGRTPEAHDFVPVRQRGSHSIMERHEEARC